MVSKIKTHVWEIHEYHVELTIKTFENSSEFAPTFSLLREPQFGEVWMKIDEPSNMILIGYLDEASGDKYVEVFEYSTEEKVRYSYCDFDNEKNHETMEALLEYVLQTERGSE